MLDVTLDFNLQFRYFHNKGKNTYSYKENRQYNGCVIVHIINWIIINLPVRQTSIKNSN